MSSFKKHCADCQEELGRSWDCVHHWLDEFAGVYWPWMGHRTHRHHSEGVEEVRSLWGDEAAKAAEIHIIEDEGNVPSRAEIHKTYGVEDNLKDFPSVDELDKEYGVDNDN